MALLTSDGKSTDLRIGDVIIHYIDRGEIAFFRDKEALYFPEREHRLHMALKDELSFNSLIVMICALQEFEFRKPEGFEDAVDGMEAYEFY